MKSLKKKRRIQVLIVAAVALVMATVLIGYGFRDGINLYRSPSQLAEAPPPVGEVFRLGGLVEEGSIVRGEGETVTFAVTDGGEVVPVSFRGVLPDLFAENAGMIGTGQMVDGVFVAEEILAKHDENYMPREVADSLKEQGVYKEPTS
ncbi:MULTISPECIES: cytochrome c maturation protein CcmE [unclassified Paracoccus (in: a-proteobacteria)]|uniref:cytochrome c maturation protein CcmE n=1 Tax=unclassified Paracoccus (in: a-proteobacteria) TaxID=2688777 RepID=UPI001603C255|nr:MULTISPECIES: cytochrome c maturation protein CcmE [unclassified Paracoccus (in: a-proteobacteria)]MBB1492438.1 cytochrome c maturation protein CcmE [Paracoccus sp. MC1854]MBB1498975.1 cytochrome c maturation protein CcmE [Paracoccus sp. MC1862]QQO45061.1 cytochrome c maturation protein CcmE [Paracoccus sp. MC1862]